MGLFDTDGKRVVDEMIAGAERRIEALEQAIRSMKDALRERKPGDGFQVYYSHQVVKDALEIYNYVAMANGATLVRGVV